MFRWAYFSGALISCAATVAVAQTTTRPTDPVFVRAQALVSDGNGAAGRALVDSVLAATPPGAPLYPQALFWRATLASNAADAESDYKHIVVDYPLAPQAEDALLRLAQLELARGDRDGALAHLQRIPRDYPRSKSLARANYWTARVLFEKNDVSNACAANTSALAQADTNEIELRNQIEYQGQRCRSIVTNTGPPVPSNAVSASSTPANQGTPPARAEKAVTVDTAPTKVSEPRANPTAAVPPESPPPKPPSATAKPTSSSSSGYSVQVAAYNHRSDADKLSSSLSKRGYQARVDGEIAPFRVRVGRYATAKEAEDALKRIKAKHMDGFVVRVPQR
jgi:cell division septation protein DedD